MDDNILKNMVKKYDTPIYIYDYDKICYQYNSLKSSIPSSFNIFYSLKANPLLGICEIFRKLGSGIEVASGGELYMAISAGFSPESIIFTSPGKTYKDLEYAICQNIYCINIESIQEANIINQIAYDKSKQVNISIRINPNFNYMTSGMNMTGISSQFGIEQSQLKEAFDILDTLKNINVIGISVYMGTQVLDADNIISNTEEIIKLAIETSRIYNFKLRYLNLGGGFGISYFENDRTLNMKKLSKGMKEVWHRRKDQLRDTRIIVESGRFLMADTSLYLTKVLYRKRSKGKTYLICDGGANHHAASAFLGRYIRDNFPIRILNKNGKEEVVNISGPLCTPIDIIGQKVKVPQNVMCGDIVVVEKSGAYGLTNSPVLFLSHSIPCEMILKDGKEYMLRERKDSKEFLNGQCSLFL